MRPNVEPLPLRLRLAESVRGPIEVEFPGARIPVWAEIVREIPAAASMLEPPSSGRITTPPFVAGEFEVVAWFPDVGTVSLGTIHHDPGIPIVHRLAVPAPARVEVALDLPPGIRQDEMVVLLGVPGFNRFGLGDFGKKAAWRELAWNAELESFTATVAPGSYTLAIDGVGVAKTRETIEVIDGAENRFSRVASIGIEVQLVFRLSRQLLGNEAIRVDVSAPERSTWFRPALGRRRSIEGLEISAWLPPGATELRAVTEKPPKWGPDVPFRALEGRRAILPGELTPGAEPPRIVIELTETAD